MLWLDISTVLAVVVVVIDVPMGGYSSEVV